jgi:hypothetical protein
MTFMGRPAVVLAVGLLCLGFEAAPVAALSCRPLEDRYVLTCREAGCEARFRARDVPSYRFRPCARHIVLEDVPRWAAPAIEEIVRRQGGAPPLGTVEVVLEGLVTAPDGDAWLPAALGTRARVRSVSEGETALRHVLEQRGADALWQSRRAWATDVFGGLLVSVILIWPCVRFMKQVWRVTRRAQVLLFMTVFGLNTLVFLGSVAVSSMHLSPVALVAAPLALVVALIELIAWALALYRGSRLHAPVQIE